MLQESQHYSSPGPNSGTLTQSPSSSIRPAAAWLPYKTLVILPFAKSATSNQAAPGTAHLC